MKQQMYGLEQPRVQSNFKRNSVDWDILNKRRSLKIAMVAACPFPANHGSPASIREMSEALAKLGHDVHIVTYPLGQKIPVERATIHRIPSLGLFDKKKILVGPSYQRLLFDLLLIIKLCQVVRQQKIEIIHAHNYEGALVGYLAKLITGRPLLYNAVNTMIDELPSYNFIRPKALARKLANLLDNFVPRTADYVTVVSNELHSFLVQRGVDPKKMSIIPAGVNPEMFTDKDPHLMRQRYHIGSRPLVIYTGTLDEFQRLDYLLRAMKIVVSEMKEAMLLIVGNIIKESHLRKNRTLVNELKIERNVIFTNERSLEELPYCLAAADVAVVPRPSCPGFPVKLLNYMAAGKAIVTFAGSAKALRDMENAIVVEDHNWEKLGEGITLLLRNPQLATQLGENARSAIDGDFDWTSLARKIGNTYFKLIEEQKWRHP